MARKSKAAQPRVYSYIRFSTPEQAEGDSERRQIEAAKAYAERHGLPFDESLRITDAGRSAFKGHHRTKGNLGAFLEAVKAGSVPTASVLVVENVDRLSREDIVDALKTIVFGLIEYGITIETLHPQATYTRASLSEGRIWQLIADINRAHSESKRKSDLGKANWKQKRKLAQEQGKLLTVRRHAWLRVLKDGRPLTDDEIKAGMARTGGGVITFELIPEVAEAVRLIYEWKRDGLGHTPITQRLNDEHSWKPKNGWRQSYVKKILSDPAVIGRYQPHRMVNGKRVPDGEPIEKYYPAVIKRDLFNAVQRLMSKNRGKGGRTGKASSLFTHLAVCAYCGGRMHFEDKGDSPKGRTYLYCEQGKRKVNDCGPRRIRYDLVEEAILTNCRRLNPERVLPDPGDRERKCRKLRQTVSGKEQELADIEQQIENLTEQVARTKSASIRDRYEKKIQLLEQQSEAVRSEHSEAGRKLREAETDKRTVEKWTRGLAALREKLAEDGNAELRLRMRNHLRELIDKIEVFSHGFAKQTDKPEGPIAAGIKGGPKSKPDMKDSFVAEIVDLVEENGLPIRNDPRWHDFLDDLAKRRMSREAGFARLWFKTGAIMDVVPEGSIASGLKLGPDGKPAFVRPNLERLWKRFVKANPKKSALAKNVW